MKLDNPHAGLMLVKKEKKSRVYFIGRSDRAKKKDKAPFGIKIFLKYLENILISKKRSCDLIWPLQQRNVTPEMSKHASATLLAYLPTCRDILLSWIDSE
jgi:hypothetical protein